jgi:hypothetical protein
MNDETTKVFARVDGPFRARIKRDAALHFGGNESMSVRRALELYLDLRETHGPRFDLAVSRMLADTEKAEAA